MGDDDARCSSILSPSSTIDYLLNRATYQNPTDEPFEIDFLAIITASVTQNLLVMVAWDPVVHRLAQSYNTFVKQDLTER